MHIKSVHVNSYEINVLEFQLVPGELLSTILLTQLLADKIDDIPLKMVHGTCCFLIFRESLSEYYTSETALCTCVNARLFVCLFGLTTYYKFK